MRSSQGLSALFLFIAGVFSLGSLLSTCILQFDRFVCCTHSDVNFAQCNEMLLAIYQIAVMPLNIGIIYTLSVIYVDPVPAPKDHPSPSTFESRQRLIMYTSYFWICCLLLYCIYVASLLMLGWGWDSRIVAGFGKLISGVVFLSTFIQYAPQIYSTFQLKAAGSVSIVTLLIQAPGTLVVIIFQILAGSSIYTWLPFVSILIQQTILVIEILVFEFLARRRKRSAETTPLSDTPSINTP